MILTFKPDLRDSGLRLDVFLKNNISSSRQTIQKAIKAGFCKIDGAVCNNPAKKIQSQSEIVCELPEIESGLVKEPNQTEILWEDKDLVVCNKPAGLTVHPCPSQTKNTLVQQILSVHPELAKMEGMRPGIAHRLDKDTSGLLLLALNEQTRLAMIDKFANRDVHKEYLCLVKGRPPSSGIIDKPIGRDPQSRIKMAIIPEKRGGKQAMTSWQLKHYFQTGDFSLLSVKIYTGRTHQIRVHLADLGFPLLGDKVYASKKIAAMAPRQMLHAWKLDFVHPQTGEKLNFMQTPPQDFFDAALENDSKMPLVVITGKPGSGKSAVTSLFAEKGYPTISADEIITDLYSSPSELMEWLKINGHDELLEDNGKAISKTRLFEHFQREPEFRAEFENYAHKLVFERIQTFYETEQKNNSELAVAEIPLYFEKGWHELFKPKPFSIGVSCKQETRWRRLHATRGWSDEKIASIDQWQWQEPKKMAACDIVINNNGSREELAENVNDALERLHKLIARNKSDKADLIKRQLDIG